MSSNPAVVVLAIALKVSATCLALWVARGGVALLNMTVVMPRSDPLRNLPGPEGTALESHLRGVVDPCSSPETHEAWQTKYGKTLRFHGFGRHDYRLMSFDLRVLTHVLSSPTYEKPWQTRAILSRLIGRGIFSMEGKEHRIQRRLIGPAFTSQSLKTMLPAFFLKAQTLCDRWSDLVTTSPDGVRDGSPDIPPAYTATQSMSKSAIVDVAHWTSRASFDVIGLVGFDYRFNALEDESEAVYGAYRRMFDVADKGPELRGILELYFPIIRSFWPNHGTKVINESLRIIKEAGKRLVAAKKSAIMASGSDNGQHTIQKDILSLLIKANLSNDPAKRLSDSELLDQCSTFLLGGSDSVSLALSWCLHYLAKYPEIQTRLRNEILGALSTSAPYSLPSFGSTDDKAGLELGHDCLFPPSSPPPQYRTTDYALPEHWKDIESLPYLNAVVLETLRICPPVHSTIRVATADDLIPISHPIILRDGTVIEKDGYLKIRKGSYIHIPIEGLNLSTEIWGDDSLTFNPDRWTSLDHSPTLPGLGNVMTFGFGPHSCLGYKFTVNEMKVFLATMLLQFTFTPAEGVEITKFNSILTRPYVKDNWELGTQLPIVVSYYTP